MCCHRHAAGDGVRATSARWPLGKSRAARQLALHQPVHEAVHDIAGAHHDQGLGVQVAGPDRGQRGWGAAWARRAVSSPMPALPPITTTVCQANSGLR
jgi:hypothetical protein